MFLITSAVLSGFLLAVVGAVLIGDKQAKPRFGTLFVAALLAIAPVFLGCFFPCVFFQAVMLVALACADALGDFKARTYFTAACVGTGLVYAVVGFVQWHALGTLQQQYPFESMESRLLDVRPTSIAMQGVAARNDVNILEGMLEEHLTMSSAGWGGGREAHLERLHEHTVQCFVNSPGFGVARAPGLTVSEDVLQRGTKEESARPVQPQPRGSEALSPGDPGVPCPSADQPDWEGFHRSCYMDFVYAEGFGLFKDRQHVAGFRPHQFRTAPERNADWRKLLSVDLVGLVMHEKPVAYVSDLLPRMDELRTAPIRELDAFETQGLAALKSGDTLFIRQHDDRLRLLGAIRATKQCVECHGCERGDLLGAFSYVLRRQ